ncbi:hypothetical protein [Desulfurivibrio dismutans]|uniref:hypothetical protein n=1 Tax=Desulfurivibrio dismutans TaxID=1398908 RepID=UPI0023DBB6FA|nr:hypothetical protein [Desulfurivibrio alkaliphilus]MDF1615069.1 hypothetical protein [Desulfurivibrio alkaliphilus]
MENRQPLITDEGLIIRHAGEIPEIAYYNSLYFLSADPQGPGLEATPAELAYLQQQVIARYCEIMLRDLTPANRDRPLYRGVRRVIWNWRRLAQFLQRHQLPPQPKLEQEVVAALTTFLDNELHEVQAGARTSCLNCTAVELAAFLRQLQLDRAPACSAWLTLCCQDAE